MYSSQFDISAATAILKELYDGQPVKNEVYKNNPTYTMIPKKKDFYGKNHPVPIQIGTSQGRSATFSNAQGNQSANVFKEFLVTRVKDYSIATIDMETLLATSNDEGAFINGAKSVIDGAMRSAVNSISMAMFRNGTGSRGVISTIGSVATGVIQLATPADVVQFELNMTLQADATDGGTPRAALGYVIAVNRSLGQVTVSTSAGGAAANPSGWTTGDYLLVQGDLNALMSGFSAWLPTAGPTSTPFFGVDRTVDATRLAGIVYNGQAQSIEEALIDGVDLINREGGAPDKGIVSFTTFGALKKSLGSKVEYVDHKVGEISFRGIQLQADSGPIDIFPDRNCQENRCYMLQMDTWCLHSIGDAPRIIPYPDNNEYLRVYNEDSAECRIGFYGQLECNAPGWNGVVLLNVD